ncbi:hypothetical protein MVEN_00006300 [Mycena venus]|uniref:Uncharacterized protein n=1 Tax=Mycena venus TaxID=2733690 RepID=A0A8H7DEK7_9AGAR|nr:hypothetical protein MVEN_00006300 [Mycena venus]
MTLNPDFQPESSATKLSLLPPPSPNIPRPHNVPDTLPTLRMIPASKGNSEGIVTLPAFTALAGRMSAALEHQCANFPAKRSPMRVAKNLYPAGSGSLSPAAASASPQIETIRATQVVVSITHCFRPHTSRQI